MNGVALPPLTPALSPELPFRRWIAWMAGEREMVPEKWAWRMGLSTARGDGLERPSYAKLVTSSWSWTR